MKSPTTVIAAVIRNTQAMIIKACLFSFFAVEVLIFFMHKSFLVSKKGEGFHRIEECRNNKSSVIFTKEGSVQTYCLLKPLSSAGAVYFNRKTTIGRNLIGFFVELRAPASIKRSWNGVGGLLKLVFAVGGLGNFRYTKTNNHEMDYTFPVCLGSYA